MSEEIRRVTGVPNVAVVSGALTARGLANGEFTEVTLGSTSKTAAEEVKTLIQVGLHNDLLLSGLSHLEARIFTFCSRSTYTLRGRMMSRLWRFVVP